MGRHLEREIVGLKRLILALGAVVEDRLGMAVKSIEIRDPDLARQVIECDGEIDDREVEIEEECLKVIALHQPVAVDLRFISTVIKINNELERIGDQAVNISERVINISRRNVVECPFDYSEMAEKTRRMLKMSLDSLVNADIVLARRVIELDDEVDAIKGDIYDKVKSTIARYPNHVGYLINFFLISRHLERIADHATNIAQEVVSLIDGMSHRYDRI